VQVVLRTVDECSFDCLRPWAFARLPCWLRGPSSMWSTVDGSLIVRRKIVHRPSFGFSLPDFPTPPPFPSLPPPSPPPPVSWLTLPYRRGSLAPTSSSTRTRTRTRKRTAARMSTATTMLPEPAALCACFIIACSFLLLRSPIPRARPSLSLDDDRPWNLRHRQGSSAALTREDKTGKERKGKESLYRDPISSLGHHRCDRPASWDRKKILLPDMDMLPLPFIQSLPHYLMQAFHFPSSLFMDIGKSRGSVYCTVLLWILQLSPFELSALRPHTSIPLYRRRFLGP